MKLASDTSLRDLTMGNRGTGITLQQVTALAENGSNLNAGLVNSSHAAAILSSGSFTASGGTNNYALSNEFNVTMDAESVTALAEDGSSANHGLWNVNNAQAMVRGDRLPVQKSHAWLLLARRGYSVPMEPLFPGKL